MTSIQSEVDRLYDLLEPAAQEIRSRFGRMPMPYDLTSDRVRRPAKGVYFFFENGEFRPNRDAPRIVRVGTHRSDKSSVESRVVNEHAKDWGRSVFRRHLGTALIRKGAFDAVIPPEDRDRWAATWFGRDGDGPVHTDHARLDPTLHPLHPVVSRAIGRMTLLWVQIPDAYHRLQFESECIRLLSNYLRGDAPIDPPSESWLGHYALSDEVRRSGLWNQLHVKKHHTPGFLDSFEKYFVPGT